MGFLLNLANKELSLKALISLGLIDPSVPEIDTLVSPITLAQLYAELTDVQNDSTDPVGPLKRKTTVQLYAKKVELDTGNPVIRNRRSTFSIYAGSSLRGKNAFPKILISKKLSISILNVVQWMPMQVLWQ